MDSQRRQEIIHENFFRFLVINNTTMSAYAKANQLDRTLLSKWKSGASNMSPEQIHQACAFFDITVNELYYTEKEIFRIEAEERNYTPPIPQRIKNFRNYKPILNKPVVLYTYLVFSIILIGMLSYILMSNSIYYVFLNLVSIFYCQMMYARYLRTKDDYIINYTDDIYYESFNEKPNNLKLTIVTRVIVIVLSVISIINIGLKLENLNESEILLNSFYILVLLFYSVVVSISIINLPYRFKKIRYDHQFEGLEQAILLSMFSILQFVIALIVYFNTSNFGFYNAMISVLFIGLNVLDYLEVTKYYNTYEIMFDAYPNPPQKLYRN